MLTVCRKLLVSLSLPPSLSLSLKISLLIGTYLNKLKSQELKTERRFLE
jgi:hypothetical protein